MRYEAATNAPLEQPHMMSGLTPSSSMTLEHTNVRPTACEPRRPAPSQVLDRRFEEAFVTPFI